MSWRLSKEHAGTGALGDLGSHLIDVTQYLTGETIESVGGTLQTVVAQRPTATPAGGEVAGRTEQVTVSLIIPRAIGRCEILPTPVEQLEEFISAGL